jgi:hypothetical protein
MVHAGQDIWRNTIDIARSTNPRPNSARARHSDAARVTIRPCKPLNTVQSRCDVQPQARDADQGVGLRRVFCLSGRAQAIACKAAIVDGGRHVLVCLPAGAQPGINALRFLRPSCTPGSERNAASKSGAFPAAWQCGPWRDRTLRTPAAVAPRHRGQQSGHSLACTFP